MNKLKEIRLQQGYTLRELAKLSGVGHSYIYGLEKGERKNPSKQTMDKLAEALKVTVAEIFY